MHGPIRGEAVLRYLSGSFDVIRPGHFVRCAVTGAEIAIEDLRYWNHERQEAYASAAIAFQRHEELRRQVAPAAPTDAAKSTE